MIFTKHYTSLHNSLQRGQLNTKHCSYSELAVKGYT